MNSWRIVCHVFGALAVDLTKAAASSGELRPIEAQRWGPRFNIDGVISIAGAARGENTTGYVQLFRNGIVEVVFADVYFNPPPDMRTAVAGIGAGHVANELAGALERIQRLFRILGVPAPVSWFTSLYGVKDVVFHVSQRLSLYGRNAFDREAILLPEIVLTNHDESAPTVLKPVLDALWQAAGLERCFDYSADGAWAPQG